MSDNLSEFAKLYSENGNDYDFDYPDGEYKVVEEGDWIEEGKYSYKETTVLFNGEYFTVQESRSGSYFTDYHYDDSYIYPAERKEETKVVVTYPATGKPIAVSARY